MLATTITDPSPKKMSTAKGLALSLFVIAMTLIGFIVITKHSTSISLLNQFNPSKSSSLIQDSLETEISATTPIIYNICSENSVWTIAGNGATTGIPPTDTKKGLLANIYAPTGIIYDPNQKYYIYQLIKMVIHRPKLERSWLMEEIM